MPKRLALFFDGTWNTPDSNEDVDGDKNTNVCRLYKAVLPAGGGTKQVAWYQEGVGTKWYNRLRGGIFGVGLSTNIQNGYRFLIDSYEPGDEVFLFGFSRGAYTARSLVGLVRNSGLLKKEHASLVPQAYSLYRTRDKEGGGADSANARFFRQKYARDAKIKCLGVWDTVGALGVPLSSFEWFNRSYYAFHDTELSGIVENAFHALAIDEHREDYPATLWAPKAKPNQRIEQVWFAGAHSNVGGGYTDKVLADITLDWMAGRATSCGLIFDRAKLPRIQESNVRGAVRDSYKEFMGGKYAKARKPYYRAIGSAEHGFEEIHPSVVGRLGSGGYSLDKHRVGKFVKGLPQR